VRKGRRQKTDEKNYKGYQREKEEGATDSLPKGSLGGVYKRIGGVPNGYKRPYGGKQIREKIGVILKRKIRALLSGKECQRGRKRTRKEGGSLSYKGAEREKPCYWAKMKSFCFYWGT